jgi:hypothetical protein
MTAPTTSGELARWSSALLSGDQSRIARPRGRSPSQLQARHRVPVHHLRRMWVRMGDITGWVIEAPAPTRATSPPQPSSPSRATARSRLRSRSAATPWSASSSRPPASGTRSTSTDFYEVYENGAWTGEIELKGIWDILNYLVIWPSGSCRLQPSRFRTPCSSGRCAPASRRWCRSARCASRAACGSSSTTSRA